MARGSSRAILLEAEWGIRFWLMDNVGEDGLPLRRDSFLPTPLKNVTVEVRGRANFDGFSAEPSPGPVLRTSDAGRRVVLDLTFFLEALDDWTSATLDPGGDPGSFELVLTPASEDMRSDQPAGPALGRTEQSPPNAGNFMDVMLRPLRVGFQVRRNESGHGYEVLADSLAAIHETESWPERGPHGQAVLEILPSGLQRILVDWKPDWLRRVEPSVHPPPFDLRPGVRRKSLVVIHNISGKVRQEHIHPLIGAALSGFTSARKTKGIHYVIDHDGHIVKMTHEDHAVKHGGGTGSSQWGRNVTGPDGVLLRERFVNNINNVAIGIEHALFEVDPDFPPALIRASVDLVGQLVQEFGIDPWNIVGHGEVNTDEQHRLKKHRFLCPGNNYPWHIYELAGLVLTPEPLSDDQFDTADVYGVPEGGVLDEKDRSAVRELRRDLHAVGYAVPEGDEFDTTVRLAVNRFQARFMNGSRPWDYVGGPIPPGWTQDLTWSPTGVVDRRTAMQIRRVVRNVPVPPAP